MAFLKEMHEDPYQVLAAYHREVKEWPAIKPGNAAGFRRFSWTFSWTAAVLCQRAIGTNLTILICCVCWWPNYLGIFGIDGIGRQNDPTKIVRKWSWLIWLIRKQCFVFHTMLCFPYMLLVNMQRVNINQKGGIKKKKKNQEFPDWTNRWKINNKILVTKEVSSMWETSSTNNCLVYLTKLVKQRSKLLYTLKMCYGFWSQYQRNAMQGNAHKQEHAR